MNKTELIKVIAVETGYTQKDIKAVLECALDTIVAHVADGDKVALAGFGNFEAVERAARTGFNPQTGESMDIPASMAPKFKASSVFKKAVKGE